MEDSVAAMHLIAAGIPGRFPDVRFIVPHFGGILPMLLNRLDGQMPQAGLAEKPSLTARRFYYDTVGWGSRAALLAAVEAFGAEQIVTGSDYPVLLRHESYKQTFDNIRDSGLPEEVIAQILGNAEMLMAGACCKGGDGA
jgi:aminocarboxymuconate-semialdehyde decarboxylase